MQPLSLPRIAFRALLTGALPTLTSLSLCMGVMSGLTLPGTATGKTISSDHEKVRHKLLFHEIRPSVVQVLTTVAEATSEISKGSGFFVSHDGLVATNYHVVSAALSRSGKLRLSVKTQDGKSYPARVVNFDLVNDLALLQLEDHAGLPTRPVKINLALKEPDIGDPLIAVGGPGELNVTFTSGYVGEWRDLWPFRWIVYTGVLNAGMSGGPALSEGGELMGIIVAKSTNAEQLGYLVEPRHMIDLIARTTARVAISPGKYQDMVRQQVQQVHFMLEAKALTGSSMHAQFGGLKIPLIFSAVVACPKSREASERDDDHPEKISVLQEAHLCRHGADLDLDHRTSMTPFSYSVRFFRGQRGWLAMRRYLESASVDELTASSRFPKTPQHCERQLVQLPNSPHRSQVLLCAAGYHKHKDLTDFSASVLIRTGPVEAVVIVMRLQGISAAGAKRYLNAVVSGVTS